MVVEERRAINIILAKSVVVCFMGQKLITDASILLTGKITKVCKITLGHYYLVSAKMIIYAELVKQILETNKKQREVGLILQVKIANLCVIYLHMVCANFKNTSAFKLNKNQQMKLY